ncbi:MAG: XrtA/PEP-CTERM system histidine kinase PrsK [Gammaproteobacteria bacterium]
MLSYVISAAVFLILLIAGLTVWRRRLAGSSLAPAFGAQLVWSVVLARAAVSATVPLALVVVIEYLRTLAWAMVLARCLAGSSDPRSIRRALRPLSALIIVVVAGLMAGMFSGQLASVDAYLERWWVWGALILSIAGLVLVEQVARNTRSAQEWRLKYVWLSIGALFTLDLCLYSIALLRGGIDPALWVARGLINAVLGGLLALGLTRIVGWQSASFLSPRLVFFNATLLGAAFYVFAMAGASYFIREFGGSWGAAGQAVFLAGAAVVLAVAVLSEQARAWARVTLAKHLFPYRYDFRREWQNLTRALSRSDGVPVYERIVKVMAISVNCGSGGLWLRDADGVFVPRGGDLAHPTAPREPPGSSFLEHLGRHEWICDLDKIRGSGEKGGSPEPPAWMLDHPKIWLIVPLVCEDTLVGFVAIGHPLARMRLTWEEIDLLRAAGRQVASYLAFEQAAKRLAEAHQFEAVNRISTILMHDLKHLVAQQALVVENAARHRGNPEFFDDAILTIENSVKRMNRLMDELKSGVLAEHGHRVDLAEVCAEVTQRCGSRKPSPTLVAYDRNVEVVLNRDRLLHALEHIVRNAQDATPSSGTVSVQLRKVAERAVIEVVDTGVGMDPQFIRDRLFRPFDTTKGGDGTGIGAFQAREFVRKCGGSIEVESAVGAGTRFLVSLPLAPPLGAVEPAGAA